MDKPVSEACLRNQQPIADRLKEYLPEPTFLLEIGSGTGQHAVYCAERLPHVSWQPSDLVAAHEGMNLWLAEANLPNILPPLVLDVEQLWPVEQVDAIFTANTIHYVPWKTVLALFEGAARILSSGSLLLIYGPFNEHGQYTSEGNARLDAWLKSNVHAEVGIKDLDQLKMLAANNDFKLQENRDMPANNRLLVFKKC
jgi:cyclopropane fatty-acyl-phospholipid synthase-like methyltransferase